MAGVTGDPARASVEGSSDPSGIALVRIAGELDLSTVPGVEVQLEPLVQASRGGVVFDLSAVTFMDSSGIAMLLRAADRVTKIEVRDPSEAVRMVIRATGLSEVLHVVP